MSSGNKPLPEPMVIERPYGSLSQQNSMHSTRIVQAVNVTVHSHVLAHNLLPNQHSVRECCQKIGGFFTKWIECIFLLGRVLCVRDWLCINRQQFYFTASDIVANILGAEPGSPSSISIGYSLTFIVITEFTCSGIMQVVLHQRGEIDIYI